MQTPMAVPCAKQTEVMCREAAHGALHCVTHRQGALVKPGQQMVRCPAHFAQEQSITERPEERAGGGPARSNLSQAAVCYQEWARKLTLVKVCA